MSSLIPFQFENKEVRVITDENGAPLFVGKDVCLALKYSDPTTAMRSHCKGVQLLHPLQTAGGIQDFRVLSEPDVLRLIVSCSLPAAQSFERLVFEEILPTIRKTGSYSVAAAPAFAIPTTMPGALSLAAEQAEQIESQAAQLVAAAPAVAFVDKYVDG